MCVILRLFSLTSLSFIELLTSPDVTMAANFTISSSDSETSEVGEPETDQDQRVPQRHNLALPELRVAGKTKDCGKW